MKYSSRTILAPIWLAIGIFCLPDPLVFGQQPLADSQIMIRDIGLRPNGMLVGQILDANSRPKVGIAIAIRAANDIVATTNSDASGVFAVTGLRGGLHQIDTPNGSTVCRFWAAGTAPPGAIDQIGIIDEQTIVRGQPRARLRHEYFPYARALARQPLIVGGAIAAAVAIPVSLRNADRAPGS